MSAPGWYPDPSGMQGQYRYWDGAGWSEATTSDPGSMGHGSTGQGPMAPGTSWGPQQQPGTTSRRSGLGVVLAIVAGVLLVALVVWLVLLRPGGRGGTGGSEDSSTPTVSAWDETSSPTPTPSDTESSKGTTVDCPSGGGDVPGRLENGRRIGGKLSFQSRGWTPGGLRMGFTHDVSVEYREIVAGEWNSDLAVGALAVADGFDEPARAATMVTQCMATSQYYLTVTGTKRVSGAKVTLDGRPGYKLVTDVLVATPPNVQGDRVTVIVIDTGDPESLSFFLSAATITDEQNLAEVAETEKTLKVEA